MATPEILTVFREIAKQLDAITALYTKLGAAVNEERSALSGFSIDKVEGFTAQRAELARRIAEETERLTQLKAELPGGAGKKLSSLVKELLDPSTAKALLLKVKKLATAVRGSNEAHQEFSQVVGHASGTLGALLGILISGNRHVNTAYTGRGAIVESSHPTRGRKGSSIKEA